MLGIKSRTRTASRKLRRCCTGHHAGRWRRSKHHGSNGHHGNRRRVTDARCCTGHHGNCRLGADARRRCTGHHGHKRRMADARCMADTQLRIAHRRRTRPLESKAVTLCKFTTYAASSARKRVTKAAELPLTVPGRRNLSRRQRIDAQVARDGRYLNNNTKIANIASGNKHKNL